jgi:hypothetical protein
MASWLVFFLISLTCLSCQYSSTETASGYQPTPIKSQKDAIMLSTNSTQGLPDSLKTVHPLWEVERQNTSNRAGSITRLYDDGQIYTWSNTRRIVVDGNPRREIAPYAWRLDAQLRPEGVTRVRDLICSGFTNLPSSGSVSTGADQGIVIRRSYLEGIEHRVVLPTSATDDLPQVIRDIDYAIQSTIIPGAVPLAQ